MRLCIQCGSVVCTSLSAHCLPARSSSVQCDTTASFVNAVYELVATEKHIMENTKPK